MAKIRISEFSAKNNFCPLVMLKSCFKDEQEHVLHIFKAPQKHVLLIFRSKQTAHVGQRLGFGPFSLAKNWKKLKTT